MSMASLNSSNKPNLPKVMYYHKLVNEKIKTSKLSNRKRLRKNSDQSKILLQEFDKNSNWDKDKISQMSERVGLSIS